MVPKQQASKNRTKYIIEEIITMSVPNQRTPALVALPSTETADCKSKIQESKTEESVVERAINETASCDLKMNTVEKGRFGTAYLAGACLSPFICGLLSDLKGRKWILIVSLFLQGYSDLFQSIVPNYWAITALKLISGIAATGQMFTVITYMSECIPSKQRNSLLTFMEFFWISGHGLASALGLAIIPLNFEYRNDFFFFRSWNLYVTICSLPAFLIGSCFIFFPETPKYLAEKGSSEQLLQVLTNMYEQNVGKSGKEYIEKLLNSGDCSIIEMVNKTRTEYSVKNNNAKSYLGTKILKELKHIGTICKPPLFKNTFFACVTAFSLSSPYYALFIWLPEIFQRFADFNSQHQNGSSSNICTVSREIHSSDPFRDQQDSFGCDRAIDNSVFINNLYMSAVCAPAVLPMTFLVNRLGFRFFIASYSITSSALILGVYFVNSSMQNLILLCLYFSLLSVCITGSFAFFAAIFPTNLRSSGVTLTSFLSRIGGVFGNTICTYLIDNNCSYLIMAVMSQLVVAAISTLIIRE
ncbi:synaptic vesicle glycoprotein 2B-like isoform X2 [Belonocnema kinseyi]|uniref:synaptic vesicle glycoprotein 2B-like isoform X2 n=1 Tax=Belonocnema kinseyi TaxID=2817044 RepID=UPI00143D8CFE|nr:synaptic vesicle glycoprotein 2B-like isoform X2 [Belonocnema kinseyi]